MKKGVHNPFVYFSHKTNFDLSGNTRALALVGAVVVAVVVVVVNVVVVVAWFNPIRLFFVCFGL